MNPPGVHPSSLIPHPFPAASPARQAGPTAGGIHRRQNLPDPHHEIIRAELLDPNVDFQEAVQHLDVRRGVRREGRRAKCPAAAQALPIPSGSIS